MSRKQRFLRNFGEIPVLGRNSTLFGPNGHFSGSGPPKHLPKPYVYKGIYAGVPKVPFWAKMCTFGSRNAKNGGIPPFLQKGRVVLKTQCVVLKKDQETIGLRKGWGKCKMVKFHEIPIFYVKSLIFHRKRKNIFVTSATFPVFRTLAARMRQP